MTVSSRIDGWIAAIGIPRSQVAAKCLFAFDGLEESLEVADAEALVLLTLNALDKHRRAVLDGLHEDLV
jgi:seryl-tRNA(Sec) selenium transferase